MGAIIPPQVVESELSVRLAKVGLKRRHQGKVRDTWELLGQPDKLLQVATDRVSIFDIVLACLVKDKGKVLTQLTAFWLTRVLDQTHHLIAYGADIDQFLPIQLRNDPELQARALVVRRLAMIPIEAVVRGYLTGSGWSSYQKERKVCGISLPEGLYDGACLAKPIFTPTTKSETGHDEPLNVEEVRKAYPGLEQISLSTYWRCATYACQKGIVIADTKFEFGLWRGSRVLGDEVCTPDSSRFWKREDWERAQRDKKSPPNYDKQVLRDWGKAKGIDKLDPTNPNDVAFVHRLYVPEEVLELTGKRYREILQILIS